MLTAYFAIQGIRCASCIASIERSLRSVEGVKSINVSLVSSKAEIVYDESKITIESLLQELDRAGYTSTYISASNLSHIKREEQASVEHLQQVFRNLLISLTLTVPLVILAMVTMHRSFSFTIVLSLALIQVCLVFPVILLSYGRLVSGLKAFYRRKPTMDTLIFLGVGSAFLYSIYQTGAIFLGDSKQYAQLYFESAGSILTLVLLGEYLEKRAKYKASKTLSALVALTPNTATKIYSDGNTKILPVSSLVIGDIVLVQQGVSVPIDGVIIQGEGMINESMLTGESMPVYKTKGDDVFGGTFVVEGVYQVRVTSLASESQIHKLITAVEKAQQSKAPIAKLADRASQYFVPFVLLIAMISGISWYIYSESFGTALSIMISTLIIACPCAMGLATPLSLIIAMGRATQYGVVIKHGVALQQTANVDVIFLDKTGTITSGVPRVSSTYLLNDEENQESLMEYIASIVHYSSHPITRALEMYTQAVKSRYSVDTFEYSVGKGIKALLKDTDTGSILYAPTYTIHIGSETFMKESGAYPNVHEEQSRIEEYCNTLYQQGISPLYVSKDNRVIAILGLKDHVREDASETVSLLARKGIRCIMLSGDVPQSAKAIANEIGIESVYAGLLPEEKASIIEEYKSKGNTCMMVGDGINDAVALCVADIGVAMGKGVDITQEASSIVLLTESLKSIYTTVMLSKVTLRNIRQNLFWAFFYNTVSIPIAAGALYGISGTLLTPMLASVAMVFSSLSVVGNALRLQYMKV